LNQKIKLLPEHIVNQIKAGEVVESPATLLKELIENSIDAKANRIDITISEDLTGHITLKDNGYGISKENLPLAFTRHATSKIYSFNDIYKLHSFGFRGEALASIASISDIICRTTQQKNTSTISIESGNIKNIEEHESNECSGTEIHIKNIFQNTPARLKFIRSRNSEKNKIKKIIDVFIISNPGITFIINIGDNEKRFYPEIKEENATEKRILQLLNKSKKRISKEDIFSKTFEYQGHHLYFIANKKSSKGSANKRQYLVANNRYFIDKKLHHTIVRKMNEYFWPQGQSGDYFCLIKVPSEMMDPNVHPSKTELKFVHHEYILSGLSSIIKNESYTHKPISKIQNSGSVTNNNAPKDFQIEDTYFFQLESKKNSSEVFTIFNQFVLIKDNEDKVQIYYTKEIFKQFIYYFYENHKTLLIETNPLLIGATFSAVEIQTQDIEKLQQLDIYLEKIQQETWILKDIPTFLSVLPTQLIKIILLGLLDKNQDIYKLAEDISLKYSKELSISVIKKIESSIKSSNYCKPILKKDLESLFTPE
jgi:DNA mismatch repair protein MutL